MTSDIHPIDPEIASFVLSDGDDGVVTEHEHCPLRQKHLADVANTGMLSARGIDRMCSRRELSVPFPSSSSSNVDVVKRFCERGAGMRKLGFTTLACTALGCIALTINRSMGISFGSTRRKYVPGSHPGFVNYIGGKVDASIPDRPSLCDPDIVRMACEVLNNETREFFGSSADADLDFVHAADLSAVLTVNKQSVHDMFSKMTLKDYDSLNPKAFAVSCQELCENLVSSFPPLVVPRMSDVGCYWHTFGKTTGIQFAPTCDVDLSPHKLAEFRFTELDPDKEAMRYAAKAVDKLSPDNHATNIIDKTLDDRGSAHITRSEEELLQTLQYPKVSDEELRRRAINLFRIHPAMNAKAEDNDGIVHFIAPGEPGEKGLGSNLTALSKNISRAFLEGNDAVEKIAKMLGHNVSSLSKVLGKNISAFFAKNVTAWGKNMSTLEKKMEKQVSSFFSNLSKNVSALGKQHTHRKLTSLEPDDSCKFALDGHCDYDTGSCDHGTDCTDCKDCSQSSTDDSCRYNRDGECDEPQYCHKGTDCSDCGTCGSQVPRASSGAISDWKRQTLQNAVKARAVLNQAISGLASRQIPDVVKQWYGNNLDNPTRNEAMRLMNDVKSMLDKVEYKYPGSLCTPSTYAYVYPNTPHNKDSFSGKFIFYLCDYYLKVNDGEQIEALLHEGSHHEAARTDDSQWRGHAMYGRRSCEDMAWECSQGNQDACDKARKNADSFSYFVNDAAKKTGRLGTVEPSGRRRAFVDPGPTSVPPMNCHSFWCKLRRAFR